MVLEITTDVLPKGIPQCPWICRIAVFQNGNKDMVHLMTNCHMLCFFKALVPLIVILCNAMGNAGFSKGRIESTLKGMQVFIRGDTLDNSEKETQIEVLSSRGMGIIHPANLKALLPNGLDMPILISDHLVREILIKGIVNDPILMLSIGLKPPSKSGVPVLMPL
jgi:hypothetical protein